MGQICIKLTDNEWDTFNECSNAVQVVNDTMVSYMISMLPSNIESIPDNVQQFINSETDMAIAVHNCVSDIVQKRNYPTTFINYKVQRLTKSLIVIYKGHDYDAKLE